MTSVNSVKEKMLILAKEKGLESSLLDFCSESASIYGDDFDSFEDVDFLFFEDVDFLLNPTGKSLYLYYYGHDGDTFINLSDDEYRPKELSSLFIACLKS